MSTCQPSRNCNDDDLTELRLGKIPPYLGIVSDSLSCVASVVMVLIYIAWKDIRKKGAQSIVTFIAIADFFTAAAYLGASINILVYRSSHHSRRQCSIFLYFCSAESVVATWAIMSSYLWTIILALYFYLSIAHNKARLAAKMMPLYHIIAWALPMFVILPLAGKDKLTYAPFVSTVWCNLDNHRDKPRNDLEVVANTLPEICGYIVILVLYMATLIHVCRFRCRTPRSDQAHAVARVEKILLFIPVLFIALRVWGTVQYIYVWRVSAHNHGCIDTTKNLIYNTLGIMQAVGGGGQGWANAILYIFLSPSIRNRLFRLPCKKPPQPYIPSTTYFSPPISNYQSISTDSVRNLM